MLLRPGTRLRQPSARVRGFARPGGSAPASLVATDVTTPATAAYTVPTGCTAVRVWTGHTPNAEPYHTLSYQRNSGTVYTVQAARYKSLTLRAAAGDVIKLATADGRQVFVAGVTPAAMSTPSGVSGTANCDAAGPSGSSEIWSPAGPHVTLADENSAFTMAVTDATERVVFVREWDGVRWLPAEWYRLPASGAAVVVRCRYKQIALGNYAGVAVTVAAPAGATVGGTSTAMSLDFSEYTGTVRNVTTVAELKTAIAAAVAGDIISLAAGTYALDVAITRTSFTANHGQTVGGSVRVGMEGILIRGATGVRGDVILTGNGTGTNGNWSLQHDTGGNAGYGAFRDLSFNFAGIGAALVCTAGRWKLQNVAASGVSSTSTNDLISFAGNSTRAIEFTALNCDASTSATDCWNGDGNAATNAAANIRLVNCSGSTGGGLTSDQIITTHTGCPMEVWGGVYSNAFQNVIAPDSTAGSNIYCYFVRTSAGARAGGISGSVSLYGCTVACNNTLTPSLYVVYNSVTASGFISTTNLLRVSAVGAVIPTVQHNRFAGNSGRCFFPSVGNQQLFRWNIVTGFAEGCRFDNYVATGSTTASNVIGNTLVSNTTGCSGTSTSLPFVVRNSAFLSNTTHLNVAASVASGSFNVASAFDVDYTSSGNDTTATAGLVTTAGPTLHLPTASGNCDNTGDLTAFGYDCGGFDWLGWPLKYGDLYASRGARARPTEANDTLIVPGVWA